MSVFERKSWYIITGASRGFGKSIALSFAKKANKESIFVLLSRDIKALKNVQTEMNSFCPELKVITYEFDQGLLDENKTGKIFENILSENNLSLDTCEQAVIIHNAGTLGDNGKLVKDLSKVDELNTYFGINVTGMILLNSAFMKMFTKDVCRYRYAINISSLTAVQPFKSFSLYCTGKAARDMFFKVLAEEECSIRVLNYAPGPIQTDMQTQCRENTADPEVKAMFQSMFEEGKILECEMSVQKLSELLEKDKFVSGAHIDYFDI